MNYNKLETHLTDMILEAQLKMGYEKNRMLLNYSFASLKNITGYSGNIDDMKEELDKFASDIKERFGNVEITRTGSMFCFKIPDQGAAYVHENIKASDFLKEFIDTLSKRGSDADTIINVFRKYSDKVHAEKTDNGEFDYLLYFEDGKPDEYYYCLTDEGLCITYHRFLKEDYLALGY